jgi:hypothetical protein
MRNRDDEDMRELKKQSDGGRGERDNAKSRDGMNNMRATKRRWMKKRRR